MSEHDEDEDGYTGPATLFVDGMELQVTVVLRGRFEPIDGFYHWYGRISPNEQLSDLLGGKTRAAVLRTPHGEASGQLTDLDVWDRYRITGSSRPPFAISAPLAGLDAEQHGKQ
jgi:Domain of unknown function (DUF4873)